MATPAVAPNVQTQTPEQIAEQLATQAVQQPTQEPSQLQREYVVETVTGQVFKGRTQQELIEALKKSVENGTATIAELNRAKQTPVIQETAAPAFDKNKYYEIWSSDPAAANDYMMQTMHGVTMGQAVAAVRDANQFTQEVRPKTVIAEWQSHSDFPTNDPAEMDKAAGAMDTVWKEMFPNGAQVTPQNLEMVHSVCLRRGLYNPEGAQQQAPDPRQQFMGAPPPPPQGGSPSNFGGQQVDPSRMTPQQIKEFLENMPR